MTVFTTQAFLVVAGALLVALATQVAADSTHPHRWGSAAFWALLGVGLIAGHRMPPLTVGYGVLAMTALVASKQVGAPHFAPHSMETLRAGAARLGDRLSFPVLLVPAVALPAGYLLPRLRGAGWTAVDAKQSSLVGIGLGCFAALVWAMRLTRERPRVAISEAGRLLQLLGWTLVLPQMLAALGGIFAKAGVGDLIAHGVAAALPMQWPAAAVVAYCVAMAVFTILLGNAFAAFPVITLGIGLPFVVVRHGGNPAIMGALGMLSGYCGTLVTPMAANFNIVPVKLLELDDERAVIRAQAPMAAAIWLFNVAVMLACVYRF